MAALKIAGQSLDDFYFIGGSGKLHHRFKGQWIGEGVGGAPAEAGNFKESGIARAADGTLFVRLDDLNDARYSTVFTLTSAGCWRPLRKSIPFGGVPSADTTFLSLSPTEGVQKRHANRPIAPVWDEARSEVRAGSRAVRAQPRRRVRPTRREARGAPPLLAPVYAQ